ncbi:MAG: tRNA (adenosine(37)-N6)-threonylcarbamoyltransferase complex ATPase subunit type 1 TsaE [Chlorobiaceae bacterium]|nr:tRNA (adenosine(37)-N6)-threonylcarbamoyltransferase complex ATPase subunit type 1 TsaE [Chlorobiaceae bacterium]NTV61390.1 tRNA (adenosine(37)-N6)-threonylcarbamoyltransferase complex ATPase subunit type 1 TsaE [Chlorobiaceae bacterium]
MSDEYFSRSPEETREYARRFASALRPDETVSLSGQLGAGKTVFMSGIAEVFNCEGQLSSPTFSLLNIYHGSLEGREVTLHHFDLYRIRTLRELEATGFDEYLSGAYLSVVEWGDRFPEYAGRFTASVTLEHAGGDTRRIVVKRTGR